MPMYMCILCLVMSGTISLSFQLMACGPGHPCSDFVAPGTTGAYPGGDYYEEAYEGDEGWGFAS